MKLTMEKALEIEGKHNYERCFRDDHGYGKNCEIEGVTAPAQVVLCPKVNFGTSPTLLFHSEEQYLKSAETYFKQQGWIQ